MQEFLTVNVQMKVPIRHDSAGRRVGIMNLVHEYVSGCYGQVSPALGNVENIASQADYDIYEKITSDKILGTLRAWEERDRKAAEERRRATV